MVQIKESWSWKTGLAVFRALKIGLKNAAKLEVRMLEVECPIERVDGLRSLKFATAFLLCEKGTYIASFFLSTDIFFISYPTFLVQTALKEIILQILFLQAAGQLYEIEQINRNQVRRYGKKLVNEYEVVWKG